MKRGQVTVFVIIGIVILAIIAVGFFLRKDIAQKIQDVKVSQSAALQQKVEEVKPFVSDCIGSTVENAILKVIGSGGYNQPKNAVDYEYYTIPVYFDKGKETVPTLESIQTEIEKALVSNIQSCANFNTFSFPVKALEKPKADVVIGKRLAEASLEWKIQVGDETESATISEFSGQTKANIADPYAYAIELYNKQKVIKVLSLIDLARLAKQKNYILHFDMAENNTMVYLLTFNTTIINKQPLVYTFAIRQEKPKAGSSTSLLSGARASGTSGASAS